MYILNSNWLLRIEYFGGIIFDKVNNEQYQISLPSAILLHLLKNGNNFEKTVKVVEDCLNTKISQEEISDLINNQVIIQYNGTVEYMNLQNQVEEILNFVKCLEKKHSLTAPIEVSIYPTSVCNIKCKFCYFESKSSHFKKYKDVSYWKKLVDELRNMGVIYLSILGGEPTLYPDINELLEYLEKIKFNTTITTNGYNVSEETINIISKSNYITPSVSIQSLNKDTTKYLNGSNIERVLSFIQTLLNKGKIPKLNTVVTIQKTEELKGILDYAASKGIKEVSFNSYMELTSSGLPVRTFNDYRSLEEQLRNYIETKGYNIYMQMQGCMLYTAYPELDNPIECEYDRFLYGCEAGKTKLEIMPNGDAYPCTAFQTDSFYYENVFENNVSDIWLNSRYLTLLRTYKNKDYKCSRCKFGDFCNGGCPANNLIKINSFETGRDTRCSIQI